ncbi:MAG: hypothetical protein GOV15_02580 [Candidatus Diapherotrites archaeon]|nr:hypothetical protein [Candidatus Diapherotrites archaeon]
MGRLKQLLTEEVGQGSWTAMYLVVVVIIALVILFTVVKPSFRRAERTVRETNIPRS